MRNGEPLALDVLVIDDEKNIRATVAMCLEGMGCHSEYGLRASVLRTTLPITTPPSHWRIPRIGLFGWPRARRQPPDSRH